MDAGWIEPVVEVPASGVVERSYAPHPDLMAGPPMVTYLTVYWPRSKTQLADDSLDWKNCFSASVSPG